MFDPLNPPHQRHYCRKANAKKSGKTDFHLDWTKGRVEHYRQLYGDDFHLIFYRDQEPMDFYSIPYRLIRDAIPETHLDSRSRWHGYIDKEVLKVTKKPHKMATLDISNFFNTHSKIIVSHTFPDPFGVGPDEDPILSHQNDGEGTVYVIVNPLFDNWVKIGCSKNLPIREKSYQTYSPGKYSVYAYIIFEKCYQLEQKLHEEILQPDPDFKSVREWHNISEEEAIQIIIDNSPESQVIYRYQ